MNLIQAFKKFGERITTYIDGVMPKALSEIENDLYYPESKEFLCKITTSNCTYTYDGGDVCIGSHSCDLTEDVVEAINKIGDTYSLYIEYTYNGISGVFNNLTNPDDIYCLLGETSADGCLMLKPRTSGGFYFSQERYQTTAMPFIFSIYLVKNAKTIDSDCVDTTIPRINAAEVGQLVSVKSTDANGVPTEWESIDNFSGSWNDLTDKPFYSEEQETWLLDKTELVYEDTNVRYARISVEAFDVFDVVGNIIKVFWDGTYYDCEILYDETNDHKYVVFDNFTAYLEADTLYITTTDNISETHEFGFFIVDEQLKLDENFIPDIIARTEDIPTEMVMYSEQELTEEQQMQARKNLGLYHNSKEPLTLWNNDDTTILSGEVVATNVKSLSNFSVYIYNKYKKLIYTVNSSDMNHIVCGNKWSGYEWVYGNTSFLSDDGYEHLGAIDTTVDTGEPIAIYNCDSDAGYYSGGHLFVLNDDYLEKSDSDGIYYVVIEDATNTETVYKQIPMEYLPDDVMKRSEFIMNWEDIENRPFYTYDGWKSVLSTTVESASTTISTSENLLEEGVTYCVDWENNDDGDSYKFECMYYHNATMGADVYYLGGNPVTETVATSDNGIIIYQNSSTDTITILVDETTISLPCAITISKLVEKVKTLDEKYLPLSDDALDSESTRPVQNKVVTEALNVHSNWDENDSTARGYIENRTHYFLPSVVEPTKITDIETNTYILVKDLSDVITDSLINNYSAENVVRKQGQSSETDSLSICGIKIVKILNGIISGTEYSNNRSSVTKIDDVNFYIGTLGVATYFIYDLGALTDEYKEIFPVVGIYFYTIVSIVTSIEVSMGTYVTIDDVFIPQDVLRARAMDFTDDEKEIARNNIDAASTQDIEDHNSSSTSHADIRELITSLQNQISELTSKISTLEQKTIALTDDGEGNVTIS